MVGQALLIKSDIETRRATNQFGIIVWQYNEIWPTGGWGSIEYGTVTHTKGQVLGGRWKPLHYWYRKTIYADVMATCGSGGSSGIMCYVKNDSPHPFTGSVDISSVKFATGQVASLQKLNLNMAAGAGTIKFFELKTDAINGTVEARAFAADMTGSMLQIKVANADGKVLCDNPVIFAEPKNLTLPNATVTFSVGAANTDGSVPIELTSDKFALYVTLTTLAQGRFDDNAFVMLPGKKTIKFFPFDGFELSELKSTLRVEHTATYM